MACKSLKVKLNNGREIPLIGLGTDKIVGQKLVTEVLDRALAIGYRHFDTAAMYGNEAEIGEALRQLLPKHNLKREDVSVTSKLYPSDHGKRAFEALKKSVRTIGLDYIDLYLIHWPGSWGNDKDMKKTRSESWKALVEGVNKGLVKSIGVSNYTIKHLKELFDNDHGIRPAVNQIEWHPHYHPDDLREFCQKQGIVVQAYMSLGGSGNKSLTGDTKVVQIAQKLGKTPAQVLLRWATKQNVAIIPKARSKEHLQENLELDFDILPEDMEILGGMKRSKYDWDPESVD